MYPQHPSTAYRLQIFLMAVVTVVAVLFFIYFITLPVARNAKAEKATKASSTLPADLSGGPNVIANGMFSGAAKLESSVNEAALAINSGLHSTSEATARNLATIAKQSVNYASPAVQSTGKGLAIVGRTAGDGLAAVVQSPIKIVGFVTGNDAVGSVIRPSEQIDVPIIDPASPELFAALSALPPTAVDRTNLQSNSGAGPVWPIDGRVTTEFGVPHWPYQVTHTGIDISGSRPSGVATVKPFRSGVVVDTVISSAGLGNHVIVDHGNGVTSVYAHLASISVEVGQSVGLSSILGYEGSTGVSTGTHLHFEIRVNGKAADPRQFVPGHP